jgi:hypothetical protein
MLSFRSITRGTMRSLTPSAIVILLLTLGSSSIANATPSFPGVVQQHLTASKAPECKVCHVGAQSSGTVKTAFGVAMLARGLVKYDEASLTKALDTLRGEKTDSNGDGKSDIDTLIAGADPSAPSSGDGGTVALASPEYGCANLAGTTPEGRIGNALLAIGVALFVARRRSGLRR